MCPRLKGLFTEDGKLCVLFRKNLKSNVEMLFFFFLVSPPNTHVPLYLYIGAGQHVRLFTSWSSCELHVASGCSEIFDFSLNMDCIRPGLMVFLIVSG